MNDYTCKAFMLETKQRAVNADRVSVELDEDAMTLRYKRDAREVNLPFQIDFLQGALLTIFVYLDPRAMWDGAKERLSSDEVAILKEDLRGAAEAFFAFIFFRDPVTGNLIDAAQMARGEESL